MEARARFALTLNPVPSRAPAAQRHAWIPAGRAWVCAVGELQAVGCFPVGCSATPQQSKLHSQHLALAAGLRGGCARGGSPG